MYAGVPIATPVAVSRESAPSWIARAMPKSVTIARPLSLSRRMLSGLMSRWITPRPCAYASASATSRSTRRTCVDGQLAILVHLARERRPFDERHDEVDEPIALIDAVDRHDVRMAQLRRRLGLAQKSRLDLAAEGQLRRQQLDRDQTFQPAILRTIHDAHAAAPELVVELIIGGERALCYSTNLRIRRYSGGIRHSRTPGGNKKPSGTRPSGRNRVCLVYHWLRDLKSRSASLAGALRQSDG